MAIIINSLLEELKLGSEINPYASYAKLPPSGKFVGDVNWILTPNVLLGKIKQEWNGSVWQTPAGVTILQKTNPGALLAPGNTSTVQIPIATIPAGLVNEGEWEIIAGYENGATNIGTDSLGLTVNGSNLFSTGMVVTGSVPQLWSHHIRFLRIGTNIRIYYYQRQGTFVSAVSGITINFSVDVNLSVQVSPGNGANNNYIRNVAIRRIN